jgi:dihydroorotase
MAMAYDLILKNGVAVLPWGEAETDIAIIDGRIAAIGSGLGPAEAVLDAKGLYILPGIIDPHVHFRDGGKLPDGAEGGIAGVEDLRSGTRGAVLGGVTTVFDMPNTEPPGTDAASLNAKRDYIAGRAWCDVGFYAGATKENVDALGEMERIEGVCGIKLFAGSSTGNLMVEDDESIERVMRAGHRRIAFHAEDEYRLQARKPLFKCDDPYSSHALWRDVECAFLGTRRILALARKTNRPAHILHVSTAEELDYIWAYRDICSVEVLLNHLVQVAPDCYDRLGGYAVMNPPIRDQRHADAAWAAVNNGIVDTIASDHAPHSRAAKERSWPNCASGLTGVQTLLPMMLDQLNQRKLSLTRLVDLMSAGPARIYGARNKGRIAVGYDADFTVVDLKKTRRIENSWIASQCGWSPFDGVTATGWPVATLIRGRIVMREDEVLGTPSGRHVSFNK